jgi:hypothetical protein
VGSPQIKPVETSYAPVVRSIPEAKRPPTAVRKVDAKELRQSRPLVKEPDRSAIRPQAKTAPLEVKKVEKPRSLSERVKERQQAAPAEKAKPQAAPPERGKPEQAAPPERGKRDQAAPAERAKPQAAPPERGKAKGSPPEKDKSKDAPTDNVSDENPRGGTEREGERGRR